MAEPPVSPIFSESVSSKDTPVTSGRRKSQVWQYFEFDADEKKSSCTVKTGNQQVCGKQIPGKYPTNLKNHLQIAHTEVYAALLEKEATERKSKAEKEFERKAASLKVSHQLTLAESLKSGQTYEKVAGDMPKSQKSWQYLLGVPMHHTILLKISNFVTSWRHLIIVTALLVGH